MVDFNPGVILAVILQVISAWVMGLGASIFFAMVMLLVALGSFSARFPAAPELMPPPELYRLPVPETEPAPVPVPEREGRAAPRTPAAAGIV